MRNIGIFSVGLITFLITPWAWPPRIFIRFSRWEFFVCKSWRAKFGSSDAIGSSPEKKSPYSTGYWHWWWCSGIIHVSTCVLIWTNRYYNKCSFFHTHSTDLESVPPTVTVSFLLSNYHHCYVFFFQLGQEQSFLYMVNGIVMIVTFALCRVFIFPLLYFVYGLHAGIPFAQVPYNIPLICNLGSVFLGGIQVYWLYGMVMVAVKFVKKRGGVEQNGQTVLVKQD